MNGGFLLLLDGSDDASRRAKEMLFWDVNNGVARRSWSGNACAQYQIAEAMKEEPRLVVTMPHVADPAQLESLLRQ
jgi:urocanate hydratase